MDIQLHSLNRFFSGALLFSGLLILFSCSDDEGPDLSAGPPPAHIETVKGVVVEPYRIEQRLQATGTFLPYEIVEVASEVPGRVISINFCESCYVREGEVLLRIDDSELDARLQKLKVDIALAEEELSRAEKLRELQAVSVEDLNRAENRVATISAEKRILEVQKEKTIVRAPFSGMTGLRQISQGSYLQAGVPVTTLRQLQPLKIEFAVPERFSHFVREKDPIWFSTTASRDTHTATIYAIDPGINTATRTLQVRATTQNKDRQFVPGGFCDVYYSVYSSEDALSVPAEAIQPQLSGQIVMVKRNGTVESVPVDVGIRTEEKVQITRGLSPGDTVITTGLLTLNEGMKVEVEVVESVENTPTRLP